MDDYISRQAAINAIRASKSKYTGFMEMEMYTDDDAVEAIEDLPSADVQPVVRCRDCKWHRVTVIGLACDKHLIPLQTDDDDYCSRGEMNLDGRLSWTG